MFACRDTKIVLFWINSIEPLFLWTFSGSSFIRSRTWSWRLLHFFNLLRTRNVHVSRWRSILWLSLWQHARSWNFCMGALSMRRSSNYFSSIGILFSRDYRLLVKIEWLRGYNFLDSLDVLGSHSAAWGGWLTSECWVSVIFVTIEEQLSFSFYLGLVSFKLSCGRVYVVCRVHWSQFLAFLATFLYFFAGFYVFYLRLTDIKCVLFW